MEKRLKRSLKNRILGGVCGGIGDYLVIDPVIIRLVWILFVLFLGWGVLFYLIAWIIIPSEKIENVEETVTEKTVTEEPVEIKTEVEE